MINILNLPGFQLFLMSGDRFGRDIDKTSSRWAMMKRYLRTAQPVNILKGSLSGANICNTYITLW